MYELQNYTDSELHYVYSSFIQKKMMQSYNIYMYIFFCTVLNSATVY